MRVAALYDIHGNLPALWAVLAKVDREVAITASSTPAASGFLMNYEGRAGAYWTLLGPSVSLRRTIYDVTDSAEQLRSTAFPNAKEMLRDSLTDPVDPDAVAAFFENLAMTS